MPLAIALPLPSRRLLLTAAAALFAVVLALVLARVLIAQVEGDRGIAPVASSADIAVGGIEVDTSGKTAEEARDAGWKLAQRKAWEKIGGPAVSDGELQSMVSAIVIESEQLGPTRYIARLGVIFDRARAGRYLGAGGERARSAPMLLVPVTFSAGTQMVYETRNPWQRAWAEYQPGASRIDYVRPSGAGGDSLLLTYGQTGRRSRTWWRNVLDQFGGSDVIVAIADLRYRWPGGPVEGTFTARHGPDSAFLETFRMTAASPAQLPAMLDRAVLRFNTIYERALAEGLLKPDPTLNVAGPEINPAILRLIELGRAAQAAQDQARAPSDAAGPSEAGEGEVITAAPVRNPPPEGSVALYTVQAATPDAAAFDAALAGVRGAGGVRNAGVRSTAIGGTSVLTVSFGGSIEELAAALRARGFIVRQGGSALAISR